MKKTARALPADFNFERLPGGAFLSGAAGNCASLTAAGLKGFLAGRAVPGLAENNFLRERLDLAGLEEALGGRYLAGWRGPRVHVITLTGRCGLRCAYCSASATAASSDMRQATARRVLDFIFSVDAPRLTLEFQGGEPLLNFAVLKLIVKDARRRAARLGREIHFSLVTNLAAMDEARFRFLMENRVTVCTSLDGPADLHDANRGRGSHAAAVKWLRRVNEYRRDHPGIEAPNAICTVTRASLGRAAEIVDAFVAAGVDRVQLGPLDPLGRAAGDWERLGYTPEEFVAFYGRALDRMAGLTLAAGRPVYEKGALNFLRETATGRRPRQRNLDLAFRLAYNHDGGIYGSDEARMLAAGGDDFFRLGTAGKDTFREIISGPLARALLLSCFQELTQPSCARCAFSPFCRVSPVYNYAAQGSFWGDMAASPRCALFKGVFRLLAAGRRDPRRRRVYAKWLAEGV